MNKRNLPLLINRQIYLKYLIILSWSLTTHSGNVSFSHHLKQWHVFILKTGKRKTEFEENLSCQLIEISSCRCCIHLQMLQHETCQFLHYEHFPHSRKEAGSMSNLMWLIYVSLPLSLYFQHGSEAFLYGLELFWLSSALELFEAEVPSIFPDFFIHFLTFTLYTFSKVLLCYGWLTCIASHRTWSFCYMKWCNFVCVCDNPIFFCLLRDGYVQQRSHTKLWGSKHVYEIGKIRHAFIVWLSVFPSTLTLKLHWGKKWWALSYTCSCYHTCVVVSLFALTEGEKFLLLTFFQKENTPTRQWKWKSVICIIRVICRYNSLK